MRNAQSSHAQLLRGTLSHTQNPPSVRLVHSSTPSPSPLPTLFRPKDSSTSVPSTLILKTSFLSRYVKASSQENLIYCLKILFIVSTLAHCRCRVAAAGQQHKLRKMAHAPPPISQMLPAAGPCCRTPATAAGMPDTSQRISLSPCFLAEEPRMGLAEQEPHPLRQPVQLPAASSRVAEWDGQ